MVETVKTIEMEESFVEIAERLSKGRRCILTTREMREMSAEQG